MIATKEINIIFHYSGKYTMDSQLKTLKINTRLY